MRVVDTLNEIFYLLDSDEKWIQGNWAAIDKGRTHAVDALDDRAQCWCLGGAVKKVLKLDTCVCPEFRAVRDPIEAAIGRLYPELTNHNMFDFNDVTAKEFGEIRAVLMVAVTIAKEAENAEALDESPRRC